MKPFSAGYLVILDVAYFAGSPTPPKHISMLIVSVRKGALQTSMMYNITKVHPFPCSHLSHLIHSLPNPNPIADWLSFPS